MPADRHLIVNADDFGLSPGINRGVIEAHERGILTSASLMVRGPAAADAAAYARAHPDLSVGLHVDLAEWRYADGAWAVVYQVIDTDDASAVRDEIDRQLDTFRRLMGRDPTHVDSHQHAHKHEPVRTAVLDVARTLDVPVRDSSPAVRYCGAFYGQTATGEPLPDAITVPRLVTLLKRLAPGVTEFGCHPGVGNDAGSTYGVEREVEVRTLCDPQVREVIAAEGITLCSFSTRGCGGDRTGERAVKRLNWGCSGHVADGWINSDIKQNRSINHTSDIRVGLGLLNDSIDYAVTIHALPEIPYAELMPVLQELRRVLRPGGILRVAVPDLDKGIQAYQQGDTTYFPIPDEDMTSLGGKFALHLIWYGYTRSVFTYDYIAELLRRSGFRDVARCEFLQTSSRYPDIVQLDNRERESLFVEATK